jgi:hypothetical protein
MTTSGEQAERRAQPPTWRDPVIVRALAWGAGVTAALALAIFLGSGGFASFDAALVAYTFATLFAAFGTAYRYAVWLQRPPTAMYWRRGWQAFLRPSELPRNLWLWVQRVVAAFGLNLFIWRRGSGRGLAHLLLMWGCVLGVAITFPLVFGWIHFTTLPGDLGSYRLHVLGRETVAFRTGSALAVLLFHGLVISSFLVIGGVMLAMRRRLTDRGLAATQRFGEDVLPLVLLFAIAVTGLLLWISYEWMEGYAYAFLAIWHASVVILTLVWIPFGKLFHVLQRPAQLGVAFYRDQGERGEQARCRVCAEPFASARQVADLIQVERELGYRYELGPAAASAGLEHYQLVCPRCRRRAFALAQAPHATGGAQHAVPTPKGIA